MNALRILLVEYSILKLLGTGLVDIMRSVNNLFYFQYR